MLQHLKYIWASLLIVLVLGACKSHRDNHVPLQYSPSILDIDPNQLSDEELEMIGQCEFWEVCAYQEYEELESFGPNRLHKNRQLFKVIKRCYFDECNSLGAADPRE